MKLILIGPSASLDEIKQAKRHGLWPKDRSLIFVAAVDAGLDAARELGIEADFAIGDWDSLSHKKHLKNIEHVTLEVEKDQSDLRAALEALLVFDKKDRPVFSEILALGFLGERTDHEFSNLLEFSNAVMHFPGTQVYLFSKKHLWWMSSGGGSLSLKSKKGQRISLFSPFGISQGVVLKGMKYSPKGGSLEPGSQGLSNFMTGTKADVKVKSGLLWVYFE